MSRMRLIDLLSHPNELDEKTLDMLKEALEAYPFFQAGRMLWIKNLHKLDHIRYNSELKLGAAFIPDRSKLFFLINDVFSSLSIPDDLPSEDDSLPSDESVRRDDANDLTEGASEKDEDPPSYPSAEIDESNDRSLDDGLSKVVGADANYFEVDDAITSATGEIVDFSLSGAADGRNFSEDLETEVEQSFETEEADESVTTPAELLDYEKETFSSSYSIEQEVPPTPLDFKESHSFSEWLNLLKHQPTQESPTGEDEIKEASEIKPQKSGKMDLIDNFLNNSGNEKRILPKEEKETSNEDFSARSVVESEDLMTETLANIHIKQKRYQKAVEIFERLSLKYPEKSVYFARRIKEMEDLINNQ
jgi:hypothetical protein